MTLSPGQHNIQLVAYNIVWYTAYPPRYGEEPRLIANWGKIKVGSRSNLSVVVNPCQTVLVSNSPSTNIVNVTTQYLAPPTPIPYEPVMIQNINTTGPVISLASGSAERCYNTAGDAMWGILKNGACGSNDHMFWVVNDLTMTTEVNSPMYCHSIYNFNGQGTIVLAGTELPWDLQQWEDPVEYMISPSTRLISLYGGFQIYGSASISSLNCYPNDYMDTGLSSVLWEQTFTIPQNHNGNIMFVGKTRVIEGPNIGYGNAFLELNLDGANVGSFGTQQLDLGYSGQQRTMTVSYLGIGLSPGIHTIRGIMHQSGTLPRLACTKDLGLIYFD